MKKLRLFSLGQKSHKTFPHPNPLLRCKCPLVPQGEGATPHLCWFKRGVTTRYAFSPLPPGEGWGVREEVKCPSVLKRYKNSIKSISYGIFLWCAAVQAAPFAYVANERTGTVSIIDIATDTVVGDMPAGK